MQTKCILKQTLSNFSFTHTTTICHNVLIITLFCQDLPTGVTPCLIEAVEIQRQAWELLQKGMAGKTVITDSRGTFLM